MNSPIEHTHRAIAEGYIPDYGTGSAPQFTSHATARLLNTTNQEAQVQTILI